LSLFFRFASSKCRGVPISCHHTWVLLVFCTVQLHSVHIHCSIKSDTTAWQTFLNSAVVYAETERTVCIAHRPNGTGAPSASCSVKSKVKFTV
jgi:hypothetical protein